MRKLCERRHIHHASYLYQEPLYSTLVSTALPSLGKGVSMACTRGFWGFCFVLFFSGRGECKEGREGTDANSRSATFQYGLGPQLFNCKVFFPPFYFVFYLIG